jgi:hypothetical protein
MKTGHLLKSVYQFSVGALYQFTSGADSPGQDLGAMRDVADAKIDEIATAQLAVDREVEHRQVSNLMGVLKLNPDRPDVLRLQRRLLTDKFAFVPRVPTEV